MRVKAHRGSNLPVAHVPRDALGLNIADVEWHSRIEQDWYAATVAIDLLAFLYAALFYQVRRGPWNIPEFKS